MLNRSEIQEAQGRFAETFRRVQSAIADKKRSSPDLLGQSFQLIREFEILSGHLYRTRSELPAEDSFRRRLEDFVGNASQELVALQKPGKTERGYRLWVGNYRRIWRENFELFVFTLLIFLATIGISWHVTVQDPHYVAAFVPQAMIEDVLDKQKWFEQVTKNPILAGVQIAVNNIRVSLGAFVLGGLFGVGGLYILIYNGLMFGSLMAFCYVNQFNEELTQFVVGHGPLELTIIVAAAFAGFIFGRVFFMRPYALLGKRLGQAARDAGTLLSGILPWLCLAAFIESFVSPWPGISLEIKVAIGVCAAVAFWAWTLWPLGAKVEMDR